MISRGAVRRPVVPERTIAMTTMRIGARRTTTTITTTVEPTTIATRRTAGSRATLARVRRTMTTMTMGRPVISRRMRSIRLKVATMMRTTRPTSDGTMPGKKLRLRKPGERVAQVVRHRPRRRRRAAAIAGSRTLRRRAKMPATRIVPMRTPATGRLGRPHRRSVPLRRPKQSQSPRRRSVRRRTRRTAVPTGNSPGRVAAGGQRP
uniref:(northern house mosquito) hypothetical protein n=1 Tax=Culex pipiens TaxID=7175 RepID=A0A8D8GMJ9_CULPI